MRGRKQDDLFVRDRVSRIRDRCPNVFSCQSRIRVQEIIFGGPLSKFAEKKLDLDPSPPDDGFSHHDVRINFDSVCRHASLRRPFFSVGPKPRRGKAAHRYQTVQTRDCDGPFARVLAR